MTEPDAELVRRARRGDAGAFDALVRRHLRAAYAVALSRTGEPADAEDLCQDAFLTALQRLEECREPDKFGPWLLAIVRNRAADLRRSQTVRAAASLDAADEVAGGESPLREAERSELRRDLERALAGLTDLQRNVLVLFDLEGYTHREIAARLGVSEGAARVHLHHARRAVRLRLADRHLGRTEHDA